VGVIPPFVFDIKWILNKIIIEYRKELIYNGWWIDG
jgi:hypothetical protein